MSPRIRAAGLAFVALAAFGAPGSAQQQPSERCAVPDTVIVRGTKRTSAAVAAGLTGIVRGDTLLGASALSRAIQALYRTGEYEAGIVVNCELLAADRAAIVFDVIERPLLMSVSVTGRERCRRHRSKIASNCCCGARSIRRS
jgi:hypothetical protein